MTSCDRQLAFNTILKRDGDDHESANYRTKTTITVPMDQTLSFLEEEGAEEENRRKPMKEREAEGGQERRNERAVHQDRGNKCRQLDLEETNCQGNWEDKREKRRMKNHEIKTKQGPKRKQML
jgi:hypothetical protein